MSDRITFRVYGDPKPQGSKTRLAHGAMVESGGAALKTWREDVKQAAFAELQRTPFNAPGAVEVAISFVMRRPLSHFRTGKHAGELKPDAPIMHTQRPDIDKLQRSTLDALTTAGAVVDDCVIAHVRATKLWADVGELSGAYVQIGDIDRQLATTA